MISNRLITLVLGCACVAAAGTGGYIATRHNATDAALSTGAPEPQPQIASVQETKGITPPAANIAPLAEDASTN
ncbi:MAG: hypothetical protein LBQ09_09720, partial [Acidobacteriaceae bacterium]|nr:hypothetical protein [Acidobacteriaceae bacterium]